MSTLTETGYNELRAQELEAARGRQLDAAKNDAQDIMLAERLAPPTGEPLQLTEAALIESIKLKPEEAVSLGHTALESQVEYAWVPEV